MWHPRNNLDQVLPHEPDDCRLLHEATPGDPVLHYAQPDHGKRPYHSTWINPYTSP